MARKKPIKRKRNPETKLHPTLQSDVYYTYFHNLPIEAQKKLKETELKIRLMKQQATKDDNTVPVEAKVWDRNELIRNFKQQ